MLADEIDIANTHREVHLNTGLELSVCVALTKEIHNEKKNSVF